MTDLLIPDVPDHVVSAIEAQARRLGLSRAEHLRRQLARMATAAETTVTVESLRWFGETFAELDDPEAMGKAWT